jgi:hypothetical protein
MERYHTRSLCYVLRSSYVVQRCIVVVVFGRQWVFKGVVGERNVMGVHTMKNEGSSIDSFNVLVVFVVAKSTGRGRRQEGGAQWRCSIVCLLC